VPGRLLSSNKHPGGDGNRKRRDRQNEEKGSTTHDFSAFGMHLSLS